MNAVRALLATGMTVLSLAVAATPPLLQRVPAARMVAAARAQIDQRLGSERDSAQVAVVGAPEDVVVPAGVVTLSLHAPVGRWPRSRVGVPVDISVAGHLVRSATVWFALGLRREVLSYAVDAPLGTPAETIKLVSRDVDVATAQGEFVKDLHEVEHMRLRRPVAAGAVAVREDFERTPDVDRQGRVKVVLTVGAIRMQANGTAAAKGNAGDVVPVLVDRAETPVLARVTDKGVVEIVQ